MAKDKRAADINEDIKLVLGAMNYLYPRYLSGDTLFKSVLSASPQYTKTRLIRDLTYLNEKGYVKFRGLHGIDAETISINDCAFALTPEGFELANRLRGDAALEI